MQDSELYARVYSKLQRQYAGMNSHVQSLALNGELTLPAMYFFSEKIKQRIQVSNLPEQQYNDIERDIDERLTDLYEKFKPIERQHLATLGSDRNA